MFQSLFSSLFGCRHDRTTFPITVSCKAPSNELRMRRTYVACLDCGAEIAYNWQKMQTEGRSREEAALHLGVATAQNESFLSRFIHAPLRAITVSDTASKT